MMWWGHGWWWGGLLLMVICAVMMMRMMGHGGHGGQTHTSDEEPELTLANRLASGEIDIDEYERRLEALRGTRRSVGT